MITKQIAVRIGVNEDQVATSSKQLSALSRLFSSTVVRELAAKGKSAVFARLVRDGDAVLRPFS
jgi:hypothetical protein